MSDQSRSGNEGAGRPDRRNGNPRRNITSIVSACALLFSAVSLYETVLRQPEIDIHVAPVIHFTHDEGREALLVPVTISNRGARDGTINAITIAATTKARTEPKQFYSAYVVSSGYFLRSRLEKSATGGLQIVKDRPKVPFAPVTISGRNSYTGTILFFPKGKEFPRLITESGDYQLTMTPSTPHASLGHAWLDQFWTPRTSTVSFAVKLGQFSIRTVERGDTVELKDASW